MKDQVQHLTNHIITKIAKSVIFSDAKNQNEIDSILNQMQKSPAEDRFKSGGSVMARGCKMGRKKATKIY